jgi:flagellar protein FliS
MNQSTPGNALGQYRVTDAYGAAAAGDRLQLISRMMQGALDRIATARGHMQRGETAAKGEQIGHAIGLVDGLRTCLDMGGGQEIAANLDSLYRYMLNRLMDANLKNDDDALAEVAELLNQVKSGWESMAANYRAEESRPEEQPVATA